jgi:hypothetical protein
MRNFITLLICLLCLGSPLFGACDTPSSYIGSTTGETDNATSLLGIDLESALEIAWSEVNQYFDNADLLEVSGQNIVYSTARPTTGEFHFWFDAWGDNTETVSLSVNWDGTVPDWATAPMGPCPFEDIEEPTNAELSEWYTFYSSFGDDVMTFCVHHMVNNYFSITLGDTPSVVATFN